MVNRDEMTETHGQIPRFNRNLLLLRAVRRDHHWLMRLALRFWQQGDKRLFQRRAMGFFPQVLRAAGCQYLARIHRHQPVKTLRLFHIGRCDQHAHIGLPLADTVD